MAMAMQPVVDDDMLAMLLQQLPRGFRFNPTDRELIEFFLMRKIAASSSSVAVAPSSLIKDFDVYSTEPWNLPSDSFMSQIDEKEMYFFSPRHPTSTSSKRVNRTAGCGFWHGSAGDTAIMIGTEVIGYRTQLAFKTRGKEKKKTNGDWIMHEFHLHSSSDDTVFDGMVLCRIYMKKGKKSADHREMGNYGVVYTKSSEQSTSSVSKFPPLMSCQESDVQSDMTWVDVAVSDGKLNVEEEEEGRRVVKRRRVKENGSMLADYNEKGTSGLANTEPLSLSSVEYKHASLTSDGSSCAVNFGDNEISEAERSLEQCQSEEPELHQCLITVNNERENCEVVNGVESTMIPSSSIGGLQADLQLINELCMAPTTDDCPLTEFMDSRMYFDVSDFGFLLSPTGHGDLESNEGHEGFSLLTSDIASSANAVEAEDGLQREGEKQAKELERQEGMMMTDTTGPIDYTECLDIQRDGVACRGELPDPPMLSDHELTVLVTEAFPYMEESLEVDDLFL